MAIEDTAADQVLRDTVGRLAIEFAGRVPRRTVVRVVTEAQRDLAGQIVPEAIGEMLHRLAHYRIDMLPARAVR